MDNRIFLNKTERETLDILNTFYNNEDRQLVNNNNNNLKVKDSCSTLDFNE
jgi:hypothetical protein